MKLAIFDIDDTLARTPRVFDPYFFEALGEHLGEPALEKALGEWTNVTDQGIAEEAIAYLGRDPTSVDVEAIKERYFAAMHAHVGDAEMVPGADSALARVAADSEWQAAIATGNWDEAGRIKLARAGLDVDGLPYAGCDDRPGRVEVMQHALALAEAAHGGAFERVVYLGDAPWDVEASRALAWPFVGVGPRIEALRALGASHVLPDLRDLEALMRGLEEARPPA